jgi:hypothetical protein
VVDSVEDLHREMSALLAAPMAIDTAISDQASPQLLAGVQAFLSSVRAPS